MKLGDICYHKATEERCVISELLSSGKVRVTTREGKSEIYHPAELWTEAEWEARNENVISR